jgi:hypothetical protein
MESLLNAYNIPVLRKYNGLGHYFQLYWGLTVFGIELYVPAKALTIAQAILENTNADPEIVITEIEEDELERLQETYQKMRQIKGWVIISSFLGVGGIFIAAYGLYQLVNYQKNIKRNAVSN